MPKHINTSQRKAAQSLLSAPPERPEDRIRQDISRLLDSMGIECVLTFRTSVGPADIFLPRRRIIIETKAVNFADNPHHPQARENNETPFQQLSRYLTAQINDDLAQLPLDEEPDMPWTGVITDGRVWHAWRFPHKHPIEHQQILDGFRPLNAEELIHQAKSLFDVKTIGKPWIPANPVSIFKHALDDLREIHAQLPKPRIRTTRTKMQLWLDMLRGSGMTPESENAQFRLFTAHCFLVALARGVVHTLLKPDTPPDPAKLLASGFLAWILEVEDGRVWAQDLLDRVHGYEWRRTAGDVLRPLYESFVDQDDRRDFGEVYTPDWLAEMMVGEILDDDWRHQAIAAATAELQKYGKTDGVGVLDPTCGSGTFLFHCAKRILDSESMKQLPPVRQADIVCRLVHGIDIHPVAVEFSRATLLRALPASPSIDNMALEIYQGDALMLRQTDRNSLFAPADDEIMIRTPQGQEMVLPRSFTEYPDFSDMLRRMVDAAARSSALPDDIARMADHTGDLEMVTACHQTLVDVIQKEGNSVWAWYIRNVLGPDRLGRRKVNRVVANPPWINLGKIQVEERKRALERLAGKDGQSGHLDLWTGGKQAASFDIAQLFIRHVRTTYLAEPRSNPSAWITKASAIRAGNWAGFRRWHTDYVAQMLDLSDAKVFGGGDARRSCVLFEVRRPAFIPIDDVEDKVVRAECTGEPPDAVLPLNEALERLRWTIPQQFPKIPSDYADDGWRVGATVVPKVLTVTAAVRAGSRADMKNVSTTRSMHPPWDSVHPRTGEIPAHWLGPLMTSKQLLPFVISSGRMETAIIPRDQDGLLLSTEVARETDFWTELDNLYHERRGMGGNTPQDLIGQIDYMRSLSSQLPLQPNGTRFVIYPASGDLMRGGHMPEGMAVIDSSLYRRPVHSITEARYLVAVLNAPALKTAFQACRSSGRHFNKDPWRAVPVPAWDADDSAHQRLAGLASRAEGIVAEMALPTGQVAASRRIRERLAEEGVFGEVDALVREILPDHVT